jgi:acetoacetate decarboxylase
MSVKLALGNAFSMPRGAPLYTAPPYHTQGNRSISILFQTTPETLQELVPAPLVSNPNSVLFVYFAQFNVVAPQMFNYLEAGIGVPVTFRDAPGQYAVYLYLDHAGAIVVGREIYGWPKKDAKISFTENNEVISAQVEREGVRLIDATVRRSERIDPLPKQPNLPWFNLKLIPSVKKNAPPDVMQLTSMQIETNLKEVQTGSATLKFGSSVLDPLGNIPVVRILEGRYTVDDGILGYGDVIYDYLAENEK